MAPALALAEGRIAVAEPLLREHLQQFPTDVAAIRMLAEVAARIGRYADAENLLARCLELAPGFKAARHNYAVVLHRHNRPVEALAQLDQVLADEPRSPSFRNLRPRCWRASANTTRPSALRAIAARVSAAGQGLAEPRPCAQDRGTAGRFDRRLSQVDRARAAPGRGVVEPGEPEDVPLLGGGRRGDAGAARARRPDPGGSVPFRLRPRQGREDARRLRESFSHYAEGNRLRKEVVHYDRGTVTESVRRSRALFTPGFFAARRGSGCAAPDPIFIVGMPRPGSTLVEQILSSHSAVEGTMELPDVVGIVAELSGRNRARRLEVPRGTRVAEPDAARTRRALPAADPHPAQDRRALASSTSCRTTGRTSGSST